METASKKRKRGRPAIFTDEQMALVQQLYPHVKSRRGQVDLAYQVDATLALGNDPAYRWLYDPAAKMVRSSILAELGRLGHPEDIKAAARWICETKPKTKQAIVMVRSARRGGPPKPSAKALAAAVFQTVERYRWEHPTMPWTAIVEAIGWGLRAAELKAEHEDRTRTASGPADPKGG